MADRPTRFTVNKQTTMSHGGNRYTPIMLDHDGHREVLVMVRTDEDENFEVADGICMYLNAMLDTSQLPGYRTPRELRWETRNDSWVAKHPDFPAGQYNVHPLRDGTFRASLSDGKDLVNIGAFPSKHYAEDACEANLATNRAMRKV